MAKRRNTKKPIDPFWWCRDDERIAHELWVKVQLPFLRAQFDAIDKKFGEIAAKQPKSAK